jgi:hypothetical protein
MSRVNWFRNAVDALAYSRPSVQPQRDSGSKPSASPSATSTATPAPRHEDSFGSNSSTVRQANYDRYFNPQQGMPDLPIGQDLRNTVAPQQFERGGWNQSTPVVEQQTSDTCGAAVVAMLGGSKTPESLQDPAQYMKDLAKVGSDGKTGTTPQEMASMLAHEGIGVTQGVKNFDQRLLDSTLEKGNKAVALVDSNEILPNGGGKGPSAPHWVVIDGKDDQGNYLVRDPATGRSDYLPASQLKDAVDTSWKKHGGGGMLAVKNSPDVSEELLQARNSNRAAALGKKGGIGSASKTTSTEANNRS